MPGSPAARKGEDPLVISNVANALPGTSEVRRLRLPGTTHDGITLEDLALASSVRRRTVFGRRKRRILRHCRNRYCQRLTDLLLEAKA
jgi:hypothetical protein